MEEGCGEGMVSSWISFGWRGLALLLECVKAYCERKTWMPLSPLGLFRKEKGIINWNFEQHGW